MHNLDFLPLNHSWMLGFIKRQFPSIGLKDYYLGSLLTTNNKKSIVYLDDEIFSNLEKDINHILNQLDPQNDILICKIAKVATICKSYGFKIIDVPFFHILDDCISLKKINGNIPILKNNKVNYFCLNRNAYETRYLTLMSLQKYNLLNHGYVTFNNTNNKNFPKIENVRYENDLSHYTCKKLLGFERNNHEIKGIDCSSNVANYFYIANNIPGSINVSVETKITSFFPTEKSFLFIFTKRLPLIIAEKNRIDSLKNEGFDVFDDVIDHSYDNIDDKTKIDFAILKNVDALRSTTLEPFLSRIENNFNYLLNEWLDKKLESLCVDINTILSQ